VFDVAGVGAPPVVTHTGQERTSEFVLSDGIEQLGLTVPEISGETPSLTVGAIQENTLWRLVHLVQNYSAGTRQDTRHHSVTVHLGGFPITNRDGIAAWSVGSSVRRLDAGGCGEID